VGDILIDNKAAQMVDSYFNSIKDILVCDPCFMNNAFETKENVGKYEKLEMLIGEAKETIAMIQPYLSANKKMLEVGGGVGLTYALLRSQGYDVISIEPGSDGFGDRHRAGLRLCDLLDIDSSGWHKNTIETFDNDNSFDLIFSFYVLEHVESLELAFSSMVRHMKPNALMLHCCPNYNIPFEPHYNILLFPFMPKWTTIFCPKLKNEGLWQGLNFTTVGAIRKQCEKQGLQPIFRRAMIANYLNRVIDDPVFRNRKMMFYKIAVVLRKLGLLKVLSILPPAVNTPMEFTTTKLPVHKN
jgi:SAM-dependent methyltransferase